MDMTGLRIRRESRLSVWSPLSPRVYLAGAHPPAFPLNRPECRLFARARHGLWQGIRALGLGPGDAVLVPAYHHGSEIEAWCAAGVRCVFYDVTDDMAPDAQQLDNALAPDVRALHITHFFGFPQDGRWWRQWCDERRLLLVEDAAQAWLAHRDRRPVGVDADLAVFCLYKTFGLPDGAAVVCRAPIPVPTGRRPLGASRVIRRHAAWAGQRVTWGLDRDAEPEYEPLVDFALGNPDTPASAITRAVLPHLDTATVAEARRARCLHLMDLLRSMVPSPFDMVSDGASPFLLPVLAPSKPWLLRTLKSHNIHSLNVWSVPHPALQAAAFPNALRLRRALVGLPVHQELCAADLSRIAQVVIDAEGK